MKKSEIVSLVESVVRAGVGIGLEEAGTRICGPTAWKFVKAMATPVFDELQHRYPKLFLVPKQAEKAAKALSTDKALVKMLNKGFANLESGQDEILALLAKQNLTLEAIGTSVDDGFTKSGRQLDTAFEKLATRLDKLELMLKTSSAPAKTTHVISPRAARLSTQQVVNQVFAYQTDAMRWIFAGDASAASQRLADGRTLVEAALKQYPENAQLLVSLGYIEKTQAQEAQIRGDHENYVAALEKAATCFANVLRRDPMDAGALNGMANVYLFYRDYDRAIKLGMLAAQSAPSYGQAFWDLAISLEGKLKEAGPKKSLIAQLKKTYQQLELLMPQQPEAFTASDFAHVQKRLRALQVL